MAESKGDSKNESSEKVNPPVLVKAISVLYFLFAFVLVVSVVFFALYFFGALSLGSALGLPSMAVGAGVAFALIPIFVILGISTGLFFGGLGLWKGKNWARMLVIVISGIFVFYGAISFSIEGLLIFLLNLSIGIYLLVNEDVKKYFGEI